MVRFEKSFTPLRCHPERSRFSGEAKDLWRHGYRASAKLHLRCVALGLLTFFTTTAFAETCLTASDMGDARTALTSTALRYFDMIAKGDTASLRQNSIPSLAADFASIENAVKGDQAALAGVKATARPPFLLQAQGSAPIERAEFFCGVVGSKGQTADSAAFVLNNLPPGKYGVVILDAPSAKGGFTASMILQRSWVREWKLGYSLHQIRTIRRPRQRLVRRPRPASFQGKGQMHDAWLYFFLRRAIWFHLFR